MTIDKPNFGNVTLRRYIPSDIGGILHVFRESVCTLCAKDYSSSQIRAWMNCADKAKWEREFASRHTTVAIENGKIVGFCDCEDSGHIDRLYVMPRHEGKGIGSMLVKDAEDSFLCDLSFVEASVTAKPFFEKLGYQTTLMQQVARNGELLINFKMEKRLDSQSL